MEQFFSGFNWTSLGVDVGIVFGIVAGCEAVKRTVFKRSKESTKNVVLLLVFMLSVIAAVSKTDPLRLQALLGNVLRYAGVSTLLYVLAKPALKKIGVKG